MKFFVVFTLAVALANATIPYRSFRTHNPLYYGMNLEQDKMMTGGTNMCDSLCGAKDLRDYRRQMDQILDKMEEIIYQKDIGKVDEFAWELIRFVLQAGQDRLGDIIRQIQTNDQLNDDAVSGKIKQLSKEEAVFIIKDLLRERDDMINSMQPPRRIQEIKDTLKLTIMAQIEMLDNSQKDLVTLRKNFRNQVEELTEMLTLLVTKSLVQKCMDKYFRYSGEIQFVNQQIYTVKMYKSLMQRGGGLETAFSQLSQHLERLVASQMANQIVLKHLERFRMGHQKQLRELNLKPIMQDYDMPMMSMSMNAIYV